MYSGGVLVFAVNSLLYLNQSLPPYGVSLNSITDYSTEFPLSKCSSICVCSVVYDFITLNSPTEVIKMFHNNCGILWRIENWPHRKYSVTASGKIDGPTGDMLALSMCYQFKCICTTENCLSYLCNQEFQQ